MTCTRWAYSASVRRAKLSSGLAGMAHNPIVP